MALSFGGATAREWGDTEQAQQLSHRAISLSVENGFYFWQAVGSCVAGRVEALGGAQESGIATMRAGLDLLGAVGSLVNRSYFLSYLAEAYLEAGQLPEGLAVVDEALALCESTFSRNCEAVLERLRGALLAAGGDVVGAEAHFRKAIAVARAQGAPFWERRARESLDQLTYQTGAALPAPTGRPNIN